MSITPSNFVPSTKYPNQIEEKTALIAEISVAQSAVTTHTHNGINSLKLSQATTHENPDTDTASSALHHTIGTGANQAAPGNMVPTVISVVGVPARLALTNLRMRDICYEAGHQQTITVTDFLADVSGSLNGLNWYPRAGFEVLIQIVDGDPVTPTEDKYIIVAVAANSSAAQVIEAMATALNSDMAFETVTYTANNLTIIFAGAFSQEAPSGGSLNLEVTIVEAGVDGANRYYEVIDPNNLSSEDGWRLVARNSTLIADLNGADNTGYTYSIGAFNIIPFSIAITILCDCYDVSTHTFIAKESGLYAFLLSMSYAEAEDSWNVQTDMLYRLNEGSWSVFAFGRTPTSSVGQSIAPTGQFVSYLNLESGDRVQFASYPSANLTAHAGGQVIRLSVTAL